MKISTAVFFGLFVVLAVISSTQGGEGKGKKGGKGGWGMMKKCKDLTNPPDKDIFKECKPQKNKGEGADGDENDNDDGGQGGGKKGKGKGKHGKGKRMGKFSFCLYTKKGLIEGGKFNLDKYNADVDKMFKDPAVAAVAKANFKKCYEADKLQDTQYTEDNMGPLAKCSFKSIGEACNSAAKSDKSGDSGDDA